MSKRMVSADNVIVNFKCPDCGYEDWASIRWILDNGSLVCKCGCDMTDVCVEIEED